MMATVLDRDAGPIDADFRILGPISVTVDGTAVKIATRRQRALLVLLLLNVGRVVPAERLIEQLWDGSPPPQAPVTLRVVRVQPSADSGSHRARGRPGHPRLRLPDGRPARHDRRQPTAHPDRARA